MSSNPKTLESSSMAIEARKILCEANEISQLLVTI